MRRLALAATNPKRLLTMAVVTEALNIALNGHPTWENDDENVDKLQLPIVDPVTRKHYALPAMSAIGSAARLVGTREFIQRMTREGPMDWGGWLSSLPPNMLREATYVLNPWVGAAVIATTGRDIHGFPVWSRGTGAAGLKEMGRAVGEATVPPLGPFVWEDDPRVSTGMKAWQTGAVLTGTPTPRLYGGGLFERTGYEMHETAQSVAGLVGKRRMDPAEAVQRLVAAGMNPTEAVSLVVSAAKRAQVPMDYRRIEAVMRQPGRAPMLPP